MRTRTVLLLLIVFIVSITSATQAKSLKPWTTKTVWEDPNNGWIYAVGNAPYKQISTEEFLTSQANATIMAIKLIQKQLAVEKVNGFQIIDFEYSTDKYFVLAAAPKTIKKIKKETKAMPWEWNFATMLEEPESKILTALKVIGTKTYDELPKNWAKFYDMNNTDKSVFIVDDYLYAIGSSLVTESYESKALLASKEKAQKQMLNKVKNARDYMLNHGDYVDVVTNLGRDEELIKNAQVHDSIRIMDIKYILIKVPLDKF
jgi:hypothetical protein